jgi:hypothetical protein
MSEIESKVKEIIVEQLGVSEDDVNRSIRIFAIYVSWVAGYSLGITAPSDAGATCSA